MSTNMHVAFGRRPQALPRSLCARRAQMYIRLHACSVLMCVLLLSCGAGCQSTWPEREARVPHGYVYYLDGAGGGGGLRNYGSGVQKGLLNAGYPGAGQIFRWNTGFGVVADQSASNKYKRKKAAELAGLIQAYKKEHPNAPMNLIGLSAGTAIAVFTLEALPESCPVDHVILLGASISATYDLTNALKRVKDELYVFTSGKDAVLRFLVPIGGTADRSSAKSAGLSGFQKPAPATSETRQQYAKLSEVPWREEFARKGNYGGHTGTVNARFVQAYIAPLILSKMPKSVSVASVAGHVANPDYARWAEFGVDSWSKVEGYQVINGVRHQTRFTERLASKQPDQLIVERIYESLDTGEVIEEREFYVMATIHPQENPLTHPEAKMVHLPPESLNVGTRGIKCEVMTVDADAEFAEWGQNVRGKVHLSHDIPGGLVRLTIKAKADSGPYEYSGTVMDYGIVPK